MQRLVERLRPADVDRLLAPGPLRPTLTRLAEAMLAAALTPEAIALYRMILAEAQRFPEVAAMANRIGARQEAVDAITTVLRAGRTGGAETARVRFAAEQFLQMVIALPQRRALGLGPPLSAEQLRAWARDTVELFLDGYGTDRAPISAAKRR